MAAEQYRPRIGVRTSQPATKLDDGQLPGASRGEVREVAAQTRSAQRPTVPRGPLQPNFTPNTNPYSPAPTQDVNGQEIPHLRIRACGGHPDHQLNQLRSEVRQGPDGELRADVTLKFRNGSSRQPGEVRIDGAPFRYVPPTTKAA